MPPGVELNVGGIGGTLGRRAGLASPPRRGVRWFAPGTSRFGAVQSAEVGSGAVSAGGRAAGRGVGAADRVPDPTRPPALPAPGPGGSSAAPRAPLSLTLLSRARRPPGGRAAPETPRGLRLGQRAVRPGCGLLAMSAASDSSGHFPLHLLVWNNDYRQLERELRDQVRGGAGPGGGGEGALRGRLARVASPPAASAPQTPQARVGAQGSEQDLGERLLCAGPRAQGFITLTLFDFAAIQAKKAVAAISVTLERRGN